VGAVLVRQQRAPLMWSKQVERGASWTVASLVPSFPAGMVLQDPSRSSGAGCHFGRCSPATHAVQQRYGCGCAPPLSSAALPRMHRHAWCSVRPRKRRACLTKRSPPTPDASSAHLRRGWIHSLDPHPAAPPPPPLPDTPPQRTQRGDVECAEGVGCAPRRLPRVHV
jgi:hypothetical protein